MNFSEMRASIMLNGQLPEQHWTKLHEIANNKILANHLMMSNLRDGPQRAKYGKDFQETLFGELITTAYFPGNVAAAANKPLSPMTSEDHLFTLFSRLLSNTDTSPLLMTWFAKAIGHNAPDVNVADQIYATEEFQRGLAKILIRLSIQWLEANGTVMICNPSLLKCMDCLTVGERAPRHVAWSVVDKLRNDSSVLVRNRLQAMELFCLAHRAVDCFYVWHCDIHLAERDVDAHSQPSATLRSLLPATTEEQNWAMQFFEMTARWLMQLALPEIRYEFEIPVGPFRRIREQVVSLPLQPSDSYTDLHDVPNVFTIGFPMYLSLLRNFNAVPAARDRGRLGAIMQLVLMLTADRKEVFTTRERFNMVESLELLTPKSPTEDPSPWYTVIEDHECRLKIVPVLLQMYEYTRQCAEQVDTPEHDHKPSVFAILSAMYSIREQRRLVFGAADVRPLVRRFMFKLLDDASDMLGELHYERRSRQLPTDPSEVTQEHAAVIEWLAHLEQRLEPEQESDVSNGMFTVPELLMCSVRMVAKVVTMSKELCQEPAIAQMIANLASGLLRQFFKSPIDRMMIDRSERLKNLMGCIAFILCAMSGDEEFCMRLLQDSRIYHIWMLRNIMTEMPDRKYGKVSYEFMCTKLHKFERGLCKKQILQRAYEKAPTRFLDGLSSQLMQDPVRLPTSKQIVDRSTVVRALMDAECDPFNRQPLRIEQVQPLERLRLKIAKWKKQINEKRSIRRAMDRIGK